MTRARLQDRIRGTLAGGQGRTDDARAKTLELQPGTDQPDAANGSVLFVGTATVIIRYAGFTILTDPNFLHQGDHVHLGYGLTSKRLTNPAMRLEDLPPIDFVLLSHYHGDHFDQLVQEKLDRTLPIISTPEAVETLKKLRFAATYALETWQALTVKKGKSSLKITSMPGRHGPPLLAKLLPQVMGSMLEFHPPAGPSMFRLYISGDTLVFDDIKEIPERYPDVNLALLHLGGTRVMGVLVTMDAKQGVQMLEVIAPDLAIPIHYNDYTVFKSPLHDFVKAVEAAKLGHKVRYLKHGERFTFQAANVRGKATLPP